jgi:hypothetical protein
VFGTVLESSELSLYSLTPWQCGEQCSVGSRRDCFVMSLLGSDAFPHSVMRWMVYPTPYTDLWRLTATRRGRRAYLQDVVQSHRDDGR